MGLTYFYRDVWPRGVVATSFAAFLCLSGCAINLPIPPDALIECSGEGECPAGYVCVTEIGRCVDPGTNQIPTVTVGLISRSLDEVIIPFTAFDAESNPVNLEVELDRGSGFERIADADGTSDTTPDGVAGSLRWSAQSTLGAAYQGDLRLRVTPSDATGVGPAVVSEPFSFGNDQPRLLSVTLDDAEVTGLTVVRVTAESYSDDPDPFSISKFEVSYMGDFSDAIDVPLSTGVGNNFPAGGLSALATGASEGPHAIVWESSLTAPVDRIGARVRLTVSSIAWRCTSGCPRRLA